MGHLDLGRFGDWDLPRWAYAVPIALLISAGAVWITISVAARPNTDLKPLIPLLVALGGGSSLLIFLMRASYNRWQPADEQDQHV
jgi:hypothetical protein